MKIYLKRDLPTPQQMKAAHKVLADWLKACRQWSKEHPRIKRGPQQSTTERATP